MTSESNKVCKNADLCPLPTYATPGAATLAGLSWSRGKR